MLVVLRLMNLAGLDELQLGLGRARSTGAASGVPALGAHASTANYVAQGNGLGLGGAVMLLVQAQALLRKPYLVVRVLPRRHVEDLLEDGARVSRNVVLHRSPMMLAFDHLTELERTEGREEQEDGEGFCTVYIRTDISPAPFFVSLSYYRLFWRFLIIPSSRHNLRVACSIRRRSCGNSDGGQGSR